MSGAEHIDIVSAQFSVINESSVVHDDCLNTRVELSDKNDNRGQESVPNLFSESSERKTSGFSSNVVGGEIVGYGSGIVNWDVGQCVDQGLNSIQADGEVFDIFGMGFPGSEPPGLSDSTVKNDGAQNLDIDASAGDNGEEQLPVGGGEGLSCKADGDGMSGMGLVDEKIPGSSVGEVGTMVGAPHMDARENCCEAGNDSGGGVGGNNEETTGEIWSLQKCENKVLEPVEVVSWESICEVAKESEENVSFVLTEDDIHQLFHESSEVDEQAQPRDLTGVLPSSVTATDNVVSDTTFSAKVIDNANCEQASKNQEECTSVSLPIDQLEQKEKPASEAKDAGTKNEQNALRSVAKLAERLHRDNAKSSGGIEENKSAARYVKASPDALSGPPLGNMDGKVRVIVLGLPADDGTVKRSYFRTPTNKTSEKRCSGRRLGKASATTEERTLQQPLVRCSRVLRSRSHEDPNASKPSIDLEHSKGSSAGRGGRKKREIKDKSQDEFSKMKTHLRYLLHRIRYEQNLLDAYSSEGWRGQSLEKLRPEKELQRAKADINRSKLKIRALFQRLDSISAEGKFPDSLYDSDGLIDSEDIFCAKCGSKDLPTGNDIILCDGICERGFHQYCLVPPLRTEEIPPGDEGWLCPACNCRVDCIDMLNDSQGGKLSIEDGWEKVFPEAAAAMAGHEQDDLMGLPSDDSDDNDYNPEGHDGDDKADGEEAGSGESELNESNSNESDSSDFSSVSEDIGAVRGDEQYVGLPSDDSEDNDFDPDAPNDDDERESSSSDFTSASEDLGATVGDDRMSDNDETSEPVHLDQDLGDSKPLSGRRHVERLDYKKLYDEEYGNDVSDSSDDEEWAENVATRKRKKVAEKNFSASPNRDVPASADTPRRRGRPGSNHQGVASPPAGLPKTPQETSSSGKSKKRPPYNRLAESVTQRLLESFKENQYPDRPTKEMLAEELGLTPARIDKWFGNARWSHRHHPSRIEASIARALPHSSAPQTLDCNEVDSASGGGIADSRKLDIEGSSGEITTQSRKRKTKSDDEPVFQTSKMETLNESTPPPVGVDIVKENTESSPLSAPEAHHGRVKRRTRSSGV